MILSDLLSLTLIPALIQPKNSSNNETTSYYNKAFRSENLTFFEQFYIQAFLSHHNESNFWEWDENESTDMIDQPKDPFETETIEDEHTGLRTNDYDKINLLDEDFIPLAASIRLDKSKQQSAILYSTQVSSTPFPSSGDRGLIFSPSKPQAIKSSTIYPILTHEENSHHQNVHSEPLVTSVINTPQESRPELPGLLTGSMSSVQQGIQNIYGRVPKALQPYPYRPTKKPDIIFDEDPVTQRPHAQLIKERSVNESEESFVFPEKLLECGPQQTQYNNSCYTALAQLPCSTGEWLVEDEQTGLGKCVENKCSGSNNVFFEGRCVPHRSPDPCPQGMKTYLYKSGRVDCDCTEGYLYNKENGKCYEAFRQGPCSESHYLILVKISTTSTDSNKTLKETRCVRNPCITDGSVCNAPKCVQQKNCVKLGDSCKHIGGVYTINKKTISLQCQELISENSNPDRIVGNVPTLTCAPGSKRDILGTCRKPSKIKLS